LTPRCLARHVLAADQQPRRRAGLAVPHPPDPHRRELEHQRADGPLAHPQGSPGGGGQLGGRQFIKSHKTEVATRDGEKKEVQLFHWNPDDRAWGMRIDHQDPETSRKVAKRIFDEVVRRVAEERKSQQSPSL
jgi:hypothetical protein